MDHCFVSPLYHFFPCGMPLTLGFEKHVEIRGMVGQRNDAVHYLEVVALVITIYDHFLTLDREFEFIWSRDWSISSVLYILTRYGGNMMVIAASVGKLLLNKEGPLNYPYASIFKSTCNAFGNVGLKVVGGVSLVNILLSQVVMQLRIKTLYRKKMTTVINILWGLEIVTAVAIGILTTYFIEVLPLSVDSMQLCVITHYPIYASAFWLPVLLFEVFLVILAFRIAWYNHQQLGSWRAARLLHVVLRDNFSFFVIVFIQYLLTAVFWLIAGPQYFLIPAMLSCSFTTIMGCRFILNLFQAYHTPRGVVAEPARSRSAWPSVAVCGMHFVDLPELEAKSPRPSVPTSTNESGNPHS